MLCGSEPSGEERRGSAGERRITTLDEPNVLWHAQRGKLISPTEYSTETFTFKGATQQRNAIKEKQISKLLISARIRDAL